MTEPDHGCRSCFGHPIYRCSVCGSRDDYIVDRGMRPVLVCTGACEAETQHETCPCFECGGFAVDVRRAYILRENALTDVTRTTRALTEVQERFAAWRREARRTWPRRLERARRA